jgi:hypothetical protein
MMTRTATWFIVAITLGSLGCPGATPIPPTPAAFSINIRFRDTDGSEQNATTFISKVDTPAGCEFRLEFNDPAAPPPRAIHQIGGPGPLAEFVVPGPGCAPPDFVATASNPNHFEQQTVYFWMFEAREYARRKLWLPTTRITLSDTRVEATLADDADFKHSCHVPPPHKVGNGCMRAWAGQNPQLYFRIGMFNAFDIVHEFGHYAAGYVFGYIDVYAWNGYDPANCQHLAFQETAADLFMTLFFHERNPGSSPVDAADVAKWDARCSEEHATGLPLIQAFEQALFARNPDGSVAFHWILSTPGSNPIDEANTAMAKAFHFALTLNQGHEIGNLAHGMLQHLRMTRSPAEVHAIEQIFRAHGFGLPIGDLTCVTNTNCMACQGDFCTFGRCDTSVPMCIPPDLTGTPGMKCTHNGQCMPGELCMIPAGSRVGQCT